MTIFDTSGIEAWVTENNPKYLNFLIKQLKTFKRTHGLNNSFNPYKAAYAFMPPHAAANLDIQQMYINGHFCYAYKFGIITNELDIVRDITFYNKDFLKSHPDIAIEKKSDSPDEDKSLADSKALIPVLTDFFNKHTLISPKAFLGDSAFDTIQTYHDLFHTLHFEKAFIPLNGRLTFDDSDCPFNEDGIPCCPKEPTLPMKREGSKSHLRCGLPTMKFVCPKMEWVWNKVTKKSKRVCHCENPCTTSSCGRMFYIYPVKISGLILALPVEKPINHFKHTFCISGCKTRNEKTVHADLLLAGIAQLVTVMVADKIHKHPYIRSLRPMISGVKQLHSFL